MADRHAAGASLLGVWAASAGIAAALVGVVPAHAQTFDEVLPLDIGSGDQRGESILQRPRTEYDPLGIRVGDYIVRPTLSEGVGYDTNVTGTQKGPGSWLVTTAPGLSFSSNYARNSFNGSIGLADTHYLSQSRQDETDVNASLGGSYQIRDDTVTVQASHAYEHEDQTAIDSATLDKPLGLQVTDIRLQYSTAFNRFSVQPSAEYMSYRFDDVTLPGDGLSQKVRDRDVFVGGVVLRYAAIPERSVVLVVRGIESRYIAALGGAPRPDSTAYEALTGVDYAISGNLRLLALVGYEVRQFENAAYRSRATPVVEAAAVLALSGLTTLTARASRSVPDAIGETTTGVIDNRATLTIDHELRRNLLFQLTGSGEIAEFSQGGGSQTAYSVGTSLSYRLNRNVTVTGSYAFTARSGSNTQQVGLLPSSTFLNTGGSYTSNIILLRAGLAL